MRKSKRSAARYGLPPPAPIPITIETEGATGSYVERDGWITVSYQGDQETAELRGMAAYPDTFARGILGEMARKRRQ